MSESSNYLDNIVTVESLHAFEDSGYTDDDLMAYAQLLMEEAVPCLPALAPTLKSPHTVLLRAAIIEMVSYLKLEESNFNQSTSPFQSETIGSYSYSKMSSRIRESGDTGVPAFDRAARILGDLCAAIDPDSSANFVAHASSEQVFSPGFNTRHAIARYSDTWVSNAYPWVPRNGRF